MKRYCKLKILPLFIVLVTFQRFLMAGEIHNHQLEGLQLSDTVKKFSNKHIVLADSIKRTSNSRRLQSDSTKIVTAKHGVRDSLKIDSNSRNKKKSDNILQILNNVDTSRRIVSWRLNSKSFDLETVEGIDTSLFFPHLIIPTQKRLETITSLGNMGAPLQSDHFFNRNSNFKFLFSRYYDDYTSGVEEHKQYNVIKPLTLIGYTMSKKTTQAEQTVHLVHTQNVNRYLNIGMTYDYFGTKGMYKNQLTRDNIFSFFSSYYRNRFSAQGTFNYIRIRNKENGGLLADNKMDHTIETTLLPFKLQAASSEVKQKGFSAILGYNVINRSVTEIDKKGNQVISKKPIFSLKALFDADKHTRTYIDTDTSFYENYYIRKGTTHDSAMIVTYESTILGELNQLAKLPGLPGMRFWITNTNGKYYYFKPSDFIFQRSDDRIETNHLGVGVFSFSPYLSYSGSLRMYINGYRAADKELLGQMIISPWKSEELPYVKAKIEISDKEPDLFMKKYYSNNFKWDNYFLKEKWFMLGGLIGADKWRFQLGYNVVRINNYTYFDTTAVPNQAPGVTITSAFVQKEFKLGGFYSTNRIVWQAYDNKEALNLPTFSVFSAFFFEYELVKKVLTGRIGANVFYRSAFYADAYSPATGQFYNQKVKKINAYPIIDGFIDFKWKHAILFFKFDHINEGKSGEEYFSALHYPLNRKTFKIGVSWLFSD